MAEGKWSQMFVGRHAFQFAVDHDLKYPSGKPTLSSDETYGLGCLNCQTVTPLGACSNCGNSEYRFGSNTQGVIGLFCSRCQRGITGWKCTSCGTENPISHETVMRLKKGGCFVATAACGDVNAPEVIYLSAFRDDVLNGSLLGRIFIRGYYTVSPYLASVIARSNALRAIVRSAFLKPVISMLRLVRK